MKATRWRVDGLELTVTRTQVLAALRRMAAASDSGARHPNQRYVLRHRGKHYPPKDVLSLATGVPKKEFSGGKSTQGANRVLADLGFVVVPKPGATAPQPHATARRIPSVQGLLRKLLRGKWVPLERACAALPDCRYPGVYLLAYSGERLSGRIVEAKDIFYVGMSNSAGGVKGRLAQFLDAIEGKDSHSGGNRFFHDYLKRVRFSKCRHGKRFFVTAVSVPCQVEKGCRSPADLRVMGEVARLEYHVLARVKGLTGREPELNKK